MLAGEVWCYLGLMKAASPLIADGLNALYRLLCEFDECVLGGMEREYGVQFATWQRSFDGMGLIWGHYHGNEFSFALEDFVQRAGFLDGLCPFSKEQLTQIGRCCEFSLEHDPDLDDGQVQIIQSI